MENQIPQTNQIGENLEAPKKSKWWIWLIITLAIIGIGSYFLLTGDSSPIANGGSSIPQPPALPN